MDGSVVETGNVPAPRWLAIGDSLTQGFSVQSPTQNWPHRLMRRRNLPAWNLGVGGVQIEPEVFRWALQRHPWQLVTIALGGNHAWHDADVETVPERARMLLDLVAAAKPGRVAWLLPPYKPCEDGKGPRAFAGLPLDENAARRFVRIRALLREAVQSHDLHPLIVDDTLPHDHRLFPDGLHPFALGFARLAESVDTALT
jgi:lysophospholipase L1-like esterase